MAESVGGRDSFLNHMDNAYGRFHGGGGPTGAVGGVSGDNQPKPWVYQPVEYVLIAAVLLIWLAAILYFIHRCRKLHFVDTNRDYLNTAARQQINKDDIPSVSVVTSKNDSVIYNQYNDKLLATMDARQRREQLLRDRRHQGQQQRHSTAGGSGSSRCRLNSKSHPIEVQQLTSTTDEDTQRLLSQEVSSSTEDPPSRVGQAQAIPKPHHSAPPLSTAFSDPPSSPPGSAIFRLTPIETIQSSSMTVGQPPPRPSRILRAHSLHTDGTQQPVPFYDLYESRHQVLSSRRGKRRHRTALTPGRSAGALHSKRRQLVRPSTMPQPPPNQRASTGTDLFTDDDPASLQPASFLAAPSSHSRRMSFDNLLTLTCSEYVRKVPSFLDLELNKLETETAEKQEQQQQIPETIGALFRKGGPVDLISQVIPESVVAESERPTTTTTTDHVVISNVDARSRSASVGENVDE